MAAVFPPPKLTGVDLNNGIGYDWDDFCFRVIRLEFIELRFLNYEFISNRLGKLQESPGLHSPSSRKNHGKSEKKRGQMV